MPKGKVHFCNSPEYSKSLSARTSTRPAAMPRSYPCRVVCVVDRASSTRTTSIVQPHGGQVGRWCVGSPYGKLRTRLAHINRLLNCIHLRRFIRCFARYTASFLLWVRGARLDFSQEGWRNVWLARTARRLAKVHIWWTQCAIYQMCARQSRCIMCNHTSTQYGRNVCTG